jgi:hypothetical protein
MRVYVMHSSTAELRICAFMLEPLEQFSWDAV